MFLSPSKCNIYRAHDPSYYQHVSRQPTRIISYTPGTDSAKLKSIYRDGDSQPSFGKLHGREVLSSTARDDSSPDLSCALSCISENGRALRGENSIHPAVTAVRATGFSRGEAPVKIFARMKAKLSNQNTPLKSTLAHEDLTPAYRLLRAQTDFEKMDIEQYPPSVDDTDAFTLSPPDSPGGSLTSEMDSGEPDAGFHGGHNNVKVIERSTPAKGSDPVGASTEPVVPSADERPRNGTAGISRPGCCVVLERMPVMQSPAKIFAMMKKDERRPRKLNLLNQTSESKENVKVMEPFMDIPVAETHHIHNRVGAACSDKSVCGTQSENISPIALQKSSNAKRAFFSPRACVSAQNGDDSMLLGSPRLAIPQKQRADSNNHDPRMIEGIQLKDWVLKLSDSRLYVDGTRVDTKIPWHSNSIAERVASNILKTVSGSTYILIGKMSNRYPSGLPQWFLKKFFGGFPQMWKEYLQTYLTECKGLNLGTQETFVPSKRKKLPLKETNPEFTYATPPEGSLGSSLKLSRSGRQIKPPLEYWRGGRVVVDKDLNVTVLEDYTIVQTPTKRVAQEKPQHMQGTKKSTASQKETCPSVSSQEEAETGLIRKAKPHQRRRVHHARDKALFQTQEISPFAVPQTQEHHLQEKEREQRGPRRSSRRSASISPQADKDKTNTHNPVFQDKGEGQVKAGGRGRPPKQESAPPWSDPDQSRRRSFRIRSKRIPEPPTPLASQSPSESEQQVMGPPKSRPKRRGRKKVLYMDDNAADVSSEDFMSDRDSTLLKRKPRGKKGTGKETREEDYNGNWTDQELQKLHEAVNYFPKYTPTFWVNVALEVGTRSPEECQEQYSAKQQNALTRSRTRQKKPQTNEGAVKDSAPKITAKAGTLRRKKEIRNVLDHLPKDDLDDVFTSSPMQKRVKKLPTFSDCGDGDRMGQLANPQTPSSSSSMFAGVKTPKCLHISPGMFPSINRNNNDKYVFHFQNEMKTGRGRGTKASTKSDEKNYIPSPAKQTEKKRVAEDDSFVVWQMFSQKEAPSVPNEESDEDYYFSDA